MMRIISIFILCIALCLAVACNPAGGSRGKSGIEHGRLTVGGEALLDGLPDGLVKIAASDSNGVLLSFTTDSSGAGVQFWRGIRLADAEHLLAIYRNKPWWTRPGWPFDESGIPRHTQALLWQRSDGRLGLLLPLPVDGYRMSLEGDSTGMAVVADNNMPAGDRGKALAGMWVAVGDDPYQLLKNSFRSAVQLAGVGSLAGDKSYPEWTDYLGWATWYAFYENVSEDKFLDALETITGAGIHLGYVLLDDGWQDATSDHRYIYSFAEDSTKFPHGMRWLGERAKQEYGAKYFMVWHTLEGLWRGLDTASTALAAYPHYFSPGNTNLPMTNRYRKSGNGRYNIFRPEVATDFFRGYHGYLAGQGVDGVKVDNQSDLSYMTYGLGPLADFTGTYVRALETSAVENFGHGRVLNCMSMVPECLYAYRDNPITRTSTDYFPDSASSWGPHLVLNAYNSLVWSNIIRPDWDMFMSGHEWAAYHAASRAISGGPVYLSDPPGKHDPALVARVALSDSRLLRPEGVAMPTADILFRDPQTEQVPLKVFNHNRAGGLILAAFHANYISDRPISGELSVAMIPGADPAAEYAVLDVDTRRPVIRRGGEMWDVALKKGGFEVYAIAPVDKGVAALGRAGMFNMGGAVLSCGWEDDNTYAVKLACGGEILFYSRHEPEKVEEAGNGVVSHTYNTSTHLLSVALDGDSPRELRLHF